MDACCPGGYTDLQDMRTMARSWLRLTARSRARAACQQQPRAIPAHQSRPHWKRKLCSVSAPRYAQGRAHHAELTHQLSLRRKAQKTGTTQASRSSNSRQSHHRHCRAQTAARHSSMTAVQTQKAGLPGEHAAGAAPSLRAQLPRCTGSFKAPLS